MVTREVLEEMVAQKLLDVVSQEDLETTYYDMQKEWAEMLSDDDLVQTAQDLGLPIQEEVLDAGTPMASRVITFSQDT